MADDLLTIAIALVKKGQFETGSKILIELLDQDKDNEDAWWWLHYCAKTNQQKIDSLNAVLKINPGNSSAKFRLSVLTGKPMKELPSLPEIEDTKQDNLTDKPVKKSPPLPKSEETKRINVEDYGGVRKNDPDEISAFGDILLSEFPESNSGMYGSRFYVGGISFSPFDLPKCVETGQSLPVSQCHMCEFFAEAECPIRKDVFLRKDATILLALKKRSWQEYRDQRDIELDTIYSELKDHGRPLHYEFVAQIINTRYPKLKIHPKRILRLMSSHPEKFENVGKGVYRAKQEKSY